MWDKPRIQPRRTADFIGSSAEREIGCAWSASEQPAQPGSSYRQNSWHDAPDVPSADLLSNRHLAGSISIRGMILPFVPAGAQHSQSPMTAESWGGDGTSMELWVPYCCAILLTKRKIWELALSTGLMLVKSFDFPPGYRILRV